MCMYFYRLVYNTLVYSQSSFRTLLYNQILQFAECYSHRDAQECTSINGSVYYKNTCYNATEVLELNITDLAHNKSARSPPAQDFFE